MNRACRDRTIARHLLCTAFVLLALACRFPAHAAVILYVEGSASQSNARPQLEGVAAFYGLEMKTLVPGDQAKLAEILEIARKPLTVAIVVDAQALSALNYRAILRGLQVRTHAIPVLVVGIDEQTSPSLLKQWSGGSIVDCQRTFFTPAVGNYRVAPVDRVTGQLGGITLPIHQERSSFLRMTAEAGAETLMEAKFSGSSMLVFARARVEQQEVFFATSTLSTQIPLTSDPLRQQMVFAAEAVPMMFFRYAGGARIWHSPGDYANLTVDDLWLREPYGHVNYKSVLQQAEKHDFHLTIAFIPWNFDRSQPAVVSLFRTHPDRLSVCVHGNNHDHQEFGPFSEHPLSEQDKNVDQSLARMDRFGKMTGVPYDAVMVFPHSISPNQTLAVLKRANFLATANSLNVPSDAIAPSDDEFALRTATLHFSNFPSLRRYSVEAEIPEAQLAIDGFLGNPMLFYAHESFFSSGSEAFNETAELVKRIQPEIKWKSLGDIARSLYLEKERDDGDFDVRAYAAVISLSNPGAEEKKFHFMKEEDFSSDFKVFVDGQSYPFEKHVSSVSLEVTLPARSTRRIEIKYGSGAHVPTDVSRRSPRVAALRFLSDFRDNVVSETHLGRWFTRSYVRYGGAWGSLMILVVACSMLATLAVCIRGGTFLKK